MSGISGGGGVGVSAGNKLIAVAIDKDKGSQAALRWATDNLIQKGQSVILVHIKVIPPNSSSSGPPISASRSSQSTSFNEDGAQISWESDSQVKELFLPFRCFCTRKDIQTHDVVIEDTDVIKALIEYVTQSTIEVLVLGAGSDGSLQRIVKPKDIPGSIMKGVPDSCTVYVISKGKILATRVASRPAPAISPLRTQNQHQASNRLSDASAELAPAVMNNPKGVPWPESDPTLPNLQNDTNFMKSPFTHRRGPNGKPYGGLSSPDTDIPFVSSGRPSIDRIFPSSGKSFDLGSNTRPASLSDFDIQSSDTYQFMRSSMDTSTPPELSLVSERSSFSGNNMTKAYSPSQSTGQSHFQGSSPNQFDVIEELRGRVARQDEVIAENQQEHQRAMAENARLLAEIYARIEAFMSTHSCTPPLS